jgi:hypothetical protein
MQSVYDLQLSKLEGDYSENRDEPLSYILAFAREWNRGMSERQEPAQSNLGNGSCNRQDSVMASASTIVIPLGNSNMQ